MWDGPGASERIRPDRGLIRSSFPTARASPSQECRAGQRFLTGDKADSFPGTRRDFGCRLLGAPRSQGNKQSHTPAAGRKDHNQWISTLGIPWGALKKKVSGPSQGQLNPNLQGWQWGPDRRVFESPSGDSSSAARVENHWCRFFCKGPNSKYFWLCGPYTLCLSSSTLPP